MYDAYIDVYVYTCIDVYYLESRQANNNYPTVLSLSLLAPYSSNKFCASRFAKKYIDKPW